MFSDISYLALIEVVENIQSLKPKFKAIKICNKKFQFIRTRALILTDQCPYFINW